MDSQTPIIRRDLITCGPSLSEGMTRRAALRLSSAGLIYGLTLAPQIAGADIKSMQGAIRDMFGTSRIEKGRIDLKIPPISENGYSVALDVEVDSPMTDEDYVKQIAVFSDRNPIPLIAQYHFTPQSARARLRTNIRLAGTQTVHVIAQMNDNSLWRATSSPVVTVAACVIF